MAKGLQIGQLPKRDVLTGNEQFPFQEDRESCYFYMNSRILSENQGVTYIGCYFRGLWIKPEI